LARQLGETRNWDVFLAETLPSILLAFPEGDEIVRLSQYARKRCVANRAAARAALKSVDYSRLLLEFAVAVLALPEGKARRLEAFAPRCLDKRAAQVGQLAAEALGGDATIRHRLRVAYKRLRYALEFFAPLFPGDSLRDYHQSASGLQEMLGRLNDLAVASELTAEALPASQGEALCCWLAGQTERLLPELEGLLGDFHLQAAPWRTQ
jgi:CHAD domain-containing protein